MRTKPLAVVVFVLSLSGEQVFARQIIPAQIMAALTAAEKLDQAVSVISKTIGPLKTQPDLAAQKLTAAWTPTIP
jgi:hypothetical protein